MSARTFRAEAIGHGTGLFRCAIEFVFSTNEIEMEKVWARARREAKKRLGFGISISIEKLEEIK